MADEPKALVVRKADLRPRDEHGMLKHRSDRIKNLLAAQVARDMEVQALAKYAFLDPEQLETVGYKGRRLTSREKRIARAWEMNKREVPAALLISSERVLQEMRSHTEKQSLSINVERAVIRVPDTRHDDAEDAVVIDVEAGSGNR